MICLTSFDPYNECSFLVRILSYSSDYSSKLKSIITATEQVSRRDFVEYLSNFFSVCCT